MAFFEELKNHSQHVYLPAEEADLRESFLTVETGADSSQVADLISSGDTEGAVQLPRVIAALPNEDSETKPEAVSVVQRKTGRTALVSELTEIHVRNFETVLSTTAVLNEATHVTDEISEGAQEHWLWEKLSLMLKMIEMSFLELSRQLIEKIFQLQEGLAQMAEDKKYHPGEAYQYLIQMIQIQMRRRELQNKINSTHMDERGYLVKHTTDLHLHPSIDIVKLNTKNDEYNTNGTRSHSGDYTKEALSMFPWRMKPDPCSSLMSPVLTSRLGLMKSAYDHNYMIWYCKIMSHFRDFCDLSFEHTKWYTATDAKSHFVRLPFTQSLSKQIAYLHDEGILSERDSDLEQSLAEQSRASRSWAACRDRHCDILDLIMAIQEHELINLEQVELLQSSETVTDYAFFIQEVLSYDLKTLSEVSEFSKSDSFLKGSKLLRKCDFSDTTWFTDLETPETCVICDINLTHYTLFASDLFKPSFLCIHNDLLIAQYECFQKLVVSETTCVLNKTRCADSLDVGTALQDKPSEVLATALLNDNAVSAKSIQSSSSLEFEQDFDSYGFEGAVTKSRNTGREGRKTPFQMFAEKNRSIPENARYEYAEAAVRSMQCSLQKSFLLLLISFISMAGLCGACQTAFHERRNCEILFPLQETRQTYLCDFGSSNSDGFLVCRDMSSLFEPEYLCCYEMNESLYRNRARYLCRPLKENWAVSGNNTYLNDAKVRNKTAEYKLNDMQFPETDWWTVLCSFTMWLGIVTIGVTAACKGTLSTHCRVQRSRRGISIICFLVDVSDAGWEMSSGKHSQYDRCQEICDPSIMKMRCDKFCEKLTAEENTCTDIFTGKMILLMTCVMFGCCLVPVLISSKYMQAMMKCSTEPCCNGQVQKVTEPGLREAILENEKDKYQSAEVVVQESKIAKLLQERDIILTYSASFLNQDMGTSICVETSAEMHIHEETNSKIPENVSRTLADVKERVKDDQVRNLQSNMKGVLNCPNSQEETERLPRYGVEMSAQNEVHAAVFSKTACPVSTEEEEEIEILLKRFDFVEKRVFCGRNEIPFDYYKQIRIEAGKHSKINNIENSRFQMRQRGGLGTKLDVKGYDYDCFKPGSGLIEERTDSANSPDRALHIPDLAMSKQSGADDKGIIKKLISNTFDRIHTSYRRPPNHFKDERFRMIAFDETASEIHNKDRVNGLRRFSPITSDGRDHQLDRGSPKYCLGENLKENDAEDDCHVLRQITWLPLNELPVPDIYTCITVHSAAQGILDRIASGERVGAQVSMKFEILRVCTFRNYPSEDKPFRILFSTAGMYYASDRDEVVCYSCGLRKAGWKETDNPIDVHKKITPSCKFLVSNSTVNFPIPELEGSQLEKFKTLEDLLNSIERPPTQQTEITGGSHGNFDLNTSHSPQYRFFVPPPKHPQYAVQSVRLDTFKGWPTNIPQTPQIMAECGYYYAGFGDCVRCFHCGIGLRHWTEDDYPWIEHARWSKDCAYLRLIKGEEFIQNVHLAIDQDEEPEDLIPATASGQPADMSQVTPNDDSNQILLTDPAQSVLEMGYQPRTIKKAIDIILRSEGRSGICAEKIMETIFMLEERSDNLEQEVANITISGASSETELQSQNSSERSHNEATDEHEKHRSEGQSLNNNKEATDELKKHRSEGQSLNNSSTGQNSSSSLTQRNTAKGQASNRNANHAQRRSEVKAQVQKGTDVKSEDKGHAKSGPRIPSNTKTKNEDAASPKSSPHSSLEEKSKGATGTSSTSRDTSKIKAENQKLKEQTICKVCLDKPVSIVFLPCGHLVTCAECAPAMKKCPICRGIVKGMVKAFMS